MAVWISNVFSSVFLVTVICLLLPNGRLAKFVKPFISLILILIILSPVVNFNGLIDDVSAIKVSFDLDENFLLDTARAKIDKLQLNCVKIAESNGINGATVLIEYSVNENYEPEISEVKIYLQNAVITSESEHIVILQRLKKGIAEYLSITENWVKIYE